MADSNEIMTIATIGNEVTLTLTRTAIILRFTDQTKSEVQKGKEEANADDTPGWARALANFALGTAEKLLNSDIEYPLADVTAITDQNGAILITHNTQRVKVFDTVVIGIKGDKKQALESFSPADAAAFVAKAQELIGK